MIKIFFFFLFKYGEKMLFIPEGVKAQDIAFVMGIVYIPLSNCFYSIQFFRWSEGVMGML